VHSDPWGITLLEDMARQEANHTKKMKGSMRESRKNGSKALLGLPQWRGGGGGGGGETPSTSESLGDDEEDEVGEIIFLGSLLLDNLPLPGDLFGWQMGAPLVPTG
jgi:hypothetical protein